MGNKNIGGAILDDLKALPKKILKPYYKNGKLNANKIAIDGIPFVIIFYVINKYVQAVVSADGGDMLDKCVKAFSLIFQVKPYFTPSFKLTPLICGIGAGVAFKLFMNSRKKNAKQFRPREEYGSAKWGTDKDFEPYTDPVKWNNIPLTATEWLRMTRPEHPKYDRNKNILIVGGSGAGKTRGFVKPSLMQMQCSYVVTDPKGTVLEEVGTMLARGAYPDGWGEHHVLTGLMYCADCGAKMYVHRTSNGKRIAQYTCSAYTKVPCGTLCKTQHRINESVVLELIGDTLRAIFEYAKYDRSEFIDTITMAQSTQEDAEVKKVRARIAVAGNRCEELEKLICRIYEDNILGKLPDSRYEVLDKQYAREKAELDAEIKELEAKLTEYEKSRNSAGKFIALIDKYEKFEELTPAMVNEFVDKVLVHERDRKGSIQTTQEIEIYFNFVGRYVPPAMMTEPTAEEQAEIDRINRIKDRRHQQYLRRKESGWQRKYEERVKNEKRAKMQAMKEEIRRQDRENGVYATAGSLALEPTIGMPE